MIDYIKGSIESLSPAAVTVEAAGIGYEINISLATYTALQGAGSTRVLIHEVIRDDAHILYGFASQRERDIFRLLIGVSGVGAATARIILSSIPADELSALIASGDHSRLRAVKGIGAKTAQRIIVDLRDKINTTDQSLLIQPATQSGDFDEALAALVMLGFPKPASSQTLRKIYDADPTLRVEDAIKKALALL